MYDDIKYWYLRDHKLFWTLSRSQIKQLCIIVGFKKAVKGDVIELANSEAPRIFLLKKGAIKVVTLTEDGQEHIKDIIRQGDLFGELELNNSEATHDMAIALTNEVSLCSFLMSDFENLLLKHPDLALSYTKFVGIRMRRLRNNYTNLISKDAKTRLLLFFKEWAEKEGVVRDGRCFIDNYLTHADIAQIVCTTRQTVTQLLNELESAGLVYYSRKEIILET